MRFLRLSTVVLAVFSMAVAFGVMNVSSVLTTWWAAQSVLSGGMLGLFLLGAFAKRTRAVHAAGATALGVLTVFWIVFGAKLTGASQILHMNLSIVAGTLTLVVAGVFLPLFAKSKKGNI